jgi:hypothetical protein
MTANPLALESRRAPRDGRPEDIDHHQTSTLARVWQPSRARLVLDGVIGLAALAFIVAACVFGGGQ